MGYCISMRSCSEFRIKKENKEAALNALKQLGSGANDSRAGGYGGGKRWFSWMNDKDPTQWDSLKEAMKAWRYPVKLDGDGNIASIDFSGEKMGDEELMFGVIAPFVEPGSFLHMRGEDGSEWRWEFHEGKLVTKNGKMVFE